LRPATFGTLKGRKGVPFQVAAKAGAAGD